MFEDMRGTCVHLIVHLGHSVPQHLAVKVTKEKSLYKFRVYKIKGGRRGRGGGGEREG